MKPNIVVQFEVSKREWEKMKNYITENNIRFYVLKRADEDKIIPLKEQR